MPGGARPVPPRLVWAVDLLDPRPDDVVLEVGGGPGVSAALICPRLSTGRLLAVDRSPVAQARARRRNPEHVAAGRLVLLEGSLTEAGLAPASVDRAVAVDVNVFWTGPADAEAAVLATVLRPGAPLFVLYGSGGPTDPGRVLPAVAGTLRRHGFEAVRTVTDDAGSGVVALAPSSAPSSPPLSAPAGTLPP